MAEPRKGRFSRHIPAVSRFAEPAAAEFDRVKADRFIRCATSLITSSCPLGALEWLGEHRPDIIQKLREMKNAVDAAVLAEDFDAFFTALEKVSKAHFRAWEVFSLRPPVIDRS